MIRIAICDDDPLARDLLVKLLRAHRDILVVGAFARGEEALAFEGPVDVWLVDVRMPTLSGHELSSALRRQNPAPEVIMITAYPDGRLAEALQAGAVGYLYKDDNPVNMVQAIRAVAAGYGVTSRDAVDGLLTPANLPVGESIATDDLDRRIVAMLLKGWSTPEIGDDLTMSESGVKKRISRMMKRAGVSSRPLLVAKLNAERASR